VKQTIKTIEMDFLILTTYHTYDNQFVLEYCIVSKLIIIKDLNISGTTQRERESLISNLSMIN
jgi:hypothetical protein